MNGRQWGTRPDNLQNIVDHVMAPVVACSLALDTAEQDVPGSVLLQWWGTCCKPVQDSSPATC